MSAHDDLTALARRWREASDAVGRAGEGLHARDQGVLFGPHGPLPAADGGGGDVVVPVDGQARLLRGVDPATARAAAVLMLFGVLDGRDAATGDAHAPADLDVLLVERSRQLGNHPGQIAFPGGAVDPGDVSVEAAALREAQEETGLDPAGVEVLGVAAPRGVPVSNFLVTPVLAWWATVSAVDVVDVAESSRVFRAPVSDLLDPAHRFTTVVRHRGREFASPGFDADGVTVWGFTGILLSAVFDELGWTVPWDEDRRIPAPR